MRGAELVFGLLADPERSGAPAWDLYRDLTLAWSRYGYRDAILEGPCVDAILANAAARGHRYCLILAPGILIRESWRGDANGEQDFHSSLARWIEKNEFLVVGRILEERILGEGGEEAGWYGLDDRCLLVDLDRHRALGAPRFGDGEQEPRAMPVPDAATHGAEIRSLQPTGSVARARPGLPGCGFVEAALRGGVPVVAFDRPLQDQFLEFAPPDANRSARFIRYLGAGISHYPEERSSAELTPDQRELLDVIALHAANAKRGVFLWNIESYADVERPPPDFRGPVSRLYSVAAGFKPNRILETHGFDAKSGVTFFDYSQSALDIRRFMLERWDGTDFPRFVGRLFERFPYPDTWYHLWRDQTPKEVAAADLEHAWERELGRWGGERAFSRHWSACSALRHEFVHCDLVGDPSPLLERLAPDPGAVVWWSNAFFTMYSNWHYKWDERRGRYESWVSRLASRNPQILIYGSDHNNTNVNWIRAGEYWKQYGTLPGDELVPRKLLQHEIRM
jgi:hypothetical protein